MSAPSVTDQLSHLDALVRYHQLYWAHVVQERPVPGMQAFLRDRWIPYFVAYTKSRDALGPSGYLEVPDFVASYVADEARKLSELRELAASIAIPNPELGSARYGVVAPDPHPSVSGDPAEVGHWFLPLALGLPAGAAGGYFYRKWQEGHPGEIVPRLHLADRLKTSTHASGEIVGDLPWHSIVGSLPWDSLIGAEGGDVARRHAWPQTKALIHSAMREVRDVQNAYPDAEAYVWSLETASTYGHRPGVVMGPTTAIVPFASREQALAHMRDRVQTEHVALALFDRTSPHWPNPVNWTKSDDPVHEDVIAQQVARYAPTRTAGEIVGDLPWWTIVGAEVDVFRRQAEAAAKEMPGRVVGIRRDARGQWQLESFSSVDAADNWFAVATSEPGLFTYAAYFDKADPLFPHPLNEASGRASSSRIAVSGIWDSISNAVLTVTGVKATNNFIKDHGLGGYVKMAATAVATVYGGPAAGAAAGALVGPVMSLGVKDKAQAAAAAQQVHGLTTMAQQHSPEMAQAVDVAHGAIKKTATAYHMAYIVKAARRGDPSAQQALDKLAALSASGDADAAAAVQLASMIYREQAQSGSSDPSLGRRERGAA